MPSLIALNESPSHKPSSSHKEPIKDNRKNLLEQEKKKVNQEKQTARKKFTNLIEKKKTPCLKNKTETKDLKQSKNRQDIKKISSPKDVSSREKIDQKIDENPKVTEGKNRKLLKSMASEPESSNIPLPILTPLPSPHENSNREEALEKKHASKNIITLAAPLQEEAQKQEIEKQSKDIYQNNNKKKDDLFSNLKDFLKNKDAPDLTGISRTKKTSQEKKPLGSNDKIEQLSPEKQIFKAPLPNKTEKSASDNNDKLKNALSKEALKNFEVRQDKNSLDASLTEEEEKEKEFSKEALLSQKNNPKDTKEIINKNTPMPKENSFILSNDSASSKQTPEIQPTLMHKTEVPKSEANFSLGTLSKNAPPLPEQASALDQIAFSIKNNPQKDQREINLQLRPDTLGRVNIKIDINNEGQALVVVATERPETRDMLQQDARHLMDLLKDSDLDLHENDISYTLSSEKDDQKHKETSDQATTESTEINLGKAHSTASLSGRGISSGMEEVRIPRYGGTWAAIA